MKKILFFVLAICVCATVSAVDTWFQPYSTCFNIDLSQTDKYNGAENDSHGSGYSDDDMIGLIGITNADDTPISGEYNFSFDFANNSNWTYISSSDPTLQIPYGVQMIIRYRVKSTPYWSHNYNDGKGSLPNTVESDHSYILGSEDNPLNSNHISGGIYQFGYGEDGLINSSSDRESSFSIAVDKLLQEFNENDNFYTKEHDINVNISEWWPLWPVYETRYYKYDNEVIGLWIDFVLVLPKNPRSDFLIIDAADYYSFFKVNISGSANAMYDIQLTGYCGTEVPDEKGSVLFTVTPNANSYSINISELLDGKEISIGDYYYTTVATKNTEEPFVNRSNYKLFVSSSPDPFNNANDAYFIMKHDDAKVDELNGRNGFYFEIGLSSEVENFRLDNNPEIWYDGTSYYAKLGTVGHPNALQSAFRKEQSMDEWVSSYYDDGQILIRCKDGQVLNLVGGGYSSTIYIHLITEI